MAFKIRFARAGLAVLGLGMGMGVGAVGGVSSAARGGEFPRFEALEIDPRVGNVCYALCAADVNGDGKLDLVAATEDAVVWYENPSWTRRDVIRGATERDNVCIQPMDVDGDGLIDFALGAAWRPTDTTGGGTLQWLGRDREGVWRVRPILSEPTMHRVRWGDVLGTGRDQLIAAPLQGRGTRGPNWNEGNGVRILVASIPDRPESEAWKVEVADDSLHTTHNLEIVDFDGDGRSEILISAWEGVFTLKRSAEGTWSRTKIGSGNQEAAPFKGASEVKLGRLRDGSRYVATIEPWHGFQVVVYTEPTGGEEEGKLWTRTVIDEPVTWGHAVWMADLDGDGDQELVIGQRDANREGSGGPRGPGVRVYDPRGRDADGRIGFDRHVIEDGGVAVEDLICADFDGDGRVDLAAGGRATHNVRIYWNRGASR